ncbi:UNVERIFIED_CONTAM: hypothetical protein NCL1_16921 [Trichonephila clavipes]
MILLQNSAWKDSRRKKKEIIFRFKIIKSGMENNLKSATTIRINPSNHIKDKSRIIVFGLAAKISAHVHTNCSSSYP